MANYVSLDEAAKLLGISSNELIEMRSRGEIFGFRDGTSWKFKTDEIDRVKQELSGDVLDDDAGGSSILVSERAGGSSKSGLVLTGDNKGSNNSDLHLDTDDGLELGSDVALVPDPSSGSGLRLVSKSSSGATEGSDLRLEGDEEELEVDASSLSLGEESGLGLGMGSELRLADDAPKAATPASKPRPAASDDSDILGGSDIKLQTTAQGGSPGFITDDGDVGLGDEIKLSPSDDDDDDLVLSSGSDLALGGDSGINLMTPSDSGLSLEDEEQLDLDGAGISGLELGSSAGSDIDVAGMAGSGSGSGSGGGSGAGLSGIDFGAASGEDFQLSPSGGFEVDEDSGSQVIEIEDSTDLGGFPTEEFPASAEGGFLEDGMAVGTGAGVGSAGAAAYRGSPEVPLATWEVFTLLSIVLLMGLSGLLVTDIVRNMWAWNGESDTSITSWFTRMIISSVRMEG